MYKEWEYTCHKNKSRARVRRQGIELQFGCNGRFVLIPSGFGNFHNYNEEALRIVRIDKSKYYKETSDIAPFKFGISFSTTSKFLTKYSFIQARKINLHRNTIVRFIVQQHGLTVPAIDRVSRACDPLSSPASTIPRSIVSRYLLRSNYETFFTVKFWVPSL